MNLIDKFTALLDGAPLAAASPQTVVVGHASTSEAQRSVYQGAHPDRPPNAPLSPEALKELRPRIVKPKPDPRELLAHVPHPSHATLQAISKRIGFTVPNELIAKLQALDTNWVSMSECAANHSYDGAVAESRRLRAELDADLAAAGENAHRVSFGKIPTRDELVEQFRPVLVAAKQRLREISADAFLTCRDVFTNFAESTNAFADECEKAEREFAESLQMPYTPSPSLLMIRKSALAVSDRAGHCEGQRPAALADFLLSL